MKIHTNLALNIHAYELSYMAAVLRKAAKNDGHYIAEDKAELEELSIFFGSVMNAIDATLELEYQKEREFERQIPSLLQSQRLTDEA
jgi:fructose-specific component phosphotransferase system IIB-like protein